MRDPEAYRTLRVLGPAILAILFATLARADETYSYAGTTFDLIKGTYTTSMKVTGSFTVPNSINPDLSLTDIGGQVSSYSFFDGIQTLTELNSEILLFDVATDGLCRLSEWTVTVWDHRLIGIPISGIDLTGTVEISRDDGFTLAICSTGGAQCESIDFSNAQNYGVTLLAPVGPWSEPANCPVFADGFESGDTTSWSLTAP